MRIVCGGELLREECNEVCNIVVRRWFIEVIWICIFFELFFLFIDNILGDLDFGLESFWGFIEIEVNV